LYIDTGLAPDTQYTYTVTARDKSINQVATAPSVAASATTIAGDIIAPNPDPMTWASPPAANSTHQTQETVIDEGFELPDQGDAGFTYGPNGTPWSFANSGYSGPNGPWYCDSTSPDPLGNQFAFLQGVAAMSRTLTGLTIGGTYEVSFFEAYRTWAGFPSGNNLSVIIDEGLGTEVVIYNKFAVTNNTWQARTSSQFVAAKTSYTLTFRATNPLGGDRTTIIDGVKVTGNILSGDPETEIIMTATAATDPSGVEYYFTCTSGLGNDSDWQDSATYIDTGLAPGTTYTYTVTARDKGINQVATAPSAEASATTAGVAPGNPIPDVVGMTHTAAEAAIVADGFTVGTVTTDYSDTVAVDDVISQDPVGGTSLPAGSSVDLVVSLGIRGDIDNNNKVDLLDFSILSANWLRNDCDALNDHCQGADIDRLNGVGLDDLIALAENWLFGAI
jgi:hypothetical protein